MIIKGKKFNAKQVLALIGYYGLAKWFPSSTVPLVGGFCRRFRSRCARVLFKQCGKNINIEHGAVFGSGLGVKIGDNSGIGINCTVPGDIEIGDNVMMGPNCYILSSNHCFERTDIPMIQQGYTPKLKTIIEDDVWIGRDVLMTAGHVVKKGTIVAARCVLTKDFPEYSIIGGNPSMLIRSRK